MNYGNKLIWWGRRSSILNLDADAFIKNLDEIIEDSLGETSEKDQDIQNVVESEKEIDPIAEAVNSM